MHCSLPTSVLHPIAVWQNYPHIPLAGPFKFYYLTQSAFYLHQILILNAEAHRKDHWQMMTHHIITSLLILGSYFTNLTRVGCLIMMLMDLPDIFLPVSAVIPLCLRIFLTRRFTSIDRKDAQISFILDDLRRDFRALYGVLVC